MGDSGCKGFWRNLVRNMDVLIAWPRSGALPERVREENFSADE
jgi:hypothetical protein